MTNNAAAAAQANKLPPALVGGLFGPENPRYPNNCESIAGGWRKKGWPLASGV